MSNSSCARATRIICGMPSTCSIGRRATTRARSSATTEFYAHKTFFDVCQQAGGTNCTMSPDANGDMKLVPMLEIEAPAGSANLP